MATPEPQAPQLDSASLIKSLPSKIGVYRMLDETGACLYVGKARNLKNRVSSYFRASGLSAKTMALMNKTADIAVTVAASETEALLLEQTFIKGHRPPYNVILRDDKSYPYIHFTEHKYPQVRLHRGAKQDKGTYFGPYPSAGAVRDSVAILQKLFQLRTCDDINFAHRTRPCLQYQIKRCTAPCVSAVSEEDYELDLNYARLFLEGKSSQVLSAFKQRMNAAADSMEFEQAALIRDQITQLVKVQEAQFVDTAHGSLDVFGIAQDSRYTCVQGLFIRDGRILGHRTWHPKNELGKESDAMLTEFVTQYYFGNVERNLPQQVLTTDALLDSDVIAAALSEKSKRKVSCNASGRTQKARWLEMVSENANLALQAHVAKKQNVFERFTDLQDRLDLDEPPQRLECFDISHSSGEATTASCVVFELDGPVKSDYRRFNIKGEQAGDDYAALEQALRRRYTRISQGDGKFPDILIIDGGRGQISRVQSVLDELNIVDLLLLGISKGENRAIGLETIWRNGNEQVDIPPNSAAMHLLQEIRDEAHRFAIAGHRAQRQKKRRVSELDDIEGVGAKRKRQLLAHFGSVARIKGSSESELAKVPGISRTMASTIYGHFHGD